MEKKSILMVIAMLLFVVVVLVGCAATPTRPETEGLIFQKPVDVVQKAAVDAIVIMGFNVKKSDPLYVEGFRPRKVGLFVGSGGETVGIWLEPLEPSKTRVRVSTAKSLVGIVGQKNWDADILAEIEKTLGTGGK
jgi:hypothetical protein